MTIRPTDPQRAATSIATKFELISDIRGGTRLGYVIWPHHAARDRRGRMPRRRAARHTRFPHCDSDKNQGRHGVMPFTKRAPRHVKSRAAGHAPVPGLQRSTRAHRLLARPEPDANSEFFAFLCRLDTARCQHLCHLVHLLPGGGACCAPPIFLRSPAALAAGGAVAPRWQCQAQVAPDEPGFLLPWYQDRRLASLRYWLPDSYSRGG